MRCMDSGALFASHGFGSDEKCSTAGSYLRQVSFVFPLNIVASEMGSLCQFP